MLTPENTAFQTWLARLRMEYLSTVEIPLTVKMESECFLLVINFISFKYLCETITMQQIFSLKLEN